MKRKSGLERRIADRLLGCMARPSKPVVDITLVAATDDNTVEDSEMLGILSPYENTIAVAMADFSERRHYIFRRCVQRVFLADVTGWPHGISELEVVHATDTAPRLPWQPLLQFSFSSSGSTVLACASFHRRVGADIERYRPIASMLQLSQRFFTRHEADHLAAIPLASRDLAFLQHWTAKEAGLKALGKGIISGLNTIVLSPVADGYHVEIKDENRSIESWSLDFPELLENHVVAVIHRPKNSG